MAYLNKVQLIGNLGKDPEIRVTQSGQKHARFSLATSERYRDKNSGEYRDRTEWHNLVGWRIVAEQIERLQVRKGTLLYVEGKIVYRSWDDPSGQKKYMTEIEIDRFQILTPREQRGGGQDWAPASQSWSGSQPSGYDQGGSAPMGSQSFDSNSGYDPADDDMPF